MVEANIRCASIRFFLTQRAPDNPDALVQHFRGANSPLGNADVHVDEAYLCGIRRNRAAQGPFRHGDQLARHGLGRPPRRRPGSRYAIDVPS